MSRADATASFVAGPLLGLGIDITFDTQPAASPSALAAALQIQLNVDLGASGLADGNLEVVVGEGDRIEFRLSAAFLALAGNANKVLAGGDALAAAVGAARSGDDTVATDSIRITIARADATTSLALGDVDNDGNPDLIVGNLDDANRVYLNNGDGSFAPGVDLAGVADATRAVAAVDLTGNGVVDILVGNDGESNRIYANTSMVGTVTFTGPTLVGLATGATTAIAIGDVDNNDTDNDTDTDADIIFGNRDQVNRLHLNVAGDFSVGANIGTEADSTTSLALADVNDDAFPELVVGNDGGFNRIHANLAGVLQAAVTLSTALVDVIDPSSTSANETVADLVQDLQVVLDRAAVAAGFNTGDLVAGTASTPVSPLLAESITIGVANPDLSVTGVSTVLSAIEARRTATANVSVEADAAVVGTLDGTTSATEVTDDDAAFPTVLAGGDLAGFVFEITAGTGMSTSARIVSNTATGLVLDGPLSLDTTSVYRITATGDDLDLLLAYIQAAVDVALEAVGLQAGAVLVQFDDSDADNDPINDPIELVPATGVVLGDLGTTIADIEARRTGTNRGDVSAGGDIAFMLDVALLGGLTDGADIVLDLQLAATGPTRAVALADINADGQRDLVVVNFDAADRVFLNNPSVPGDFGAIPLALGVGDSRTTALTVTEFDGRAGVDIVTALGARAAVGTANRTISASVDVAPTAGNLTIDDLLADIQAALDTTLVNAGLRAVDVVAVADADGQVRLESGSVGIALLDPSVAEAAIDVRRDILLADAVTLPVQVNPDLTNGGTDPAGALGPSTLINIAGTLTVASSANTVTDTSATFPTLPAGELFKVTAGTGAGEIAVIVSNSATSVVLDRNVTVGTDSQYRISNLFNDDTELLRFVLQQQIDAALVTAGAPLAAGDILVSIDPAGPLAGSPFADRIILTPQVDRLIIGNAEALADLIEARRFVNAPGSTDSAGGVDPDGKRAVLSGDVASPLSFTIELPATTAQFDGTAAVNFELQVFGPFDTPIATAAAELVGDGVALALPAGPFVLVEVQDAVLGVLAAELSAERITLQRTVVAGEALVQVEVENLALSLGSGAPPPVLISVAAAQLSITSVGVVASIDAVRVTTNIENFAFAASAKVLIDTTSPSSKFVRVEATDTLITLFGQSIGGNFVIESVVSDNGDSVLRLAAANVTMLLGAFDKDTNLNGEVGDAGDDPVYAVTVTSGQGFFVLTSFGVAGSLRVSAAFELPGTLTLSADSVSVEVNTTNAPVDETLTFLGDTLELALPGGPFVRVNVLGATLTVTDSLVLSGDFGFEQVGSGLDVITLMAVANLSLSVSADGGSAVQVVNGAGALAFLPDDPLTLLIDESGIAGILSGDVQIAAGGLALGASATIRLNTRATAVSRQVSLGGRDFDITFSGDEVAVDGTPFIALVGGSVSLVIGDFLVFQGTLNRVPGPPVTIEGTADLFVGDGPLFLEDADGAVAIDEAAETVVSGTVDSATTTATTTDVTDTGAFTAAAPGGDLAGLLFQVTAGTGKGGSATIVSNTTDGLVLNTVLTLDNTSDYRVIDPSVGINPAAVGLRLVDAAFLVQEFDDGAGNNTYAAFARGQVQIIGIAGVSFVGLADVRINTTDAPQTLNLDLDGDGTGDETAMLQAGELRIAATGIDLVVDGQLLRGNFSFGKVGDTITVGFDQVTLSLANDALVLDQEGQGTFILDAQGLAGTMSVNATLAAGTDASFVANFAVAINSSPLPVQVSVDAVRVAVDPSLSDDNAATDALGATTDLLADLQAVVDAALLTSGFAAGDVLVSEAVAGDGDTLPNRIVFSSANADVVLLNADALEATLAAARSTVIGVTVDPTDTVGSNDQNALVAALQGAVDEALVVAALRQAGVSSDQLALLLDTDTVADAVFDADALAAAAITQAEVSAALLAADLVPGDIDVTLGTAVVGSQLPNPITFQAGADGVSFLDTTEAENAIAARRAAGVVVSVDAAVTDNNTSNEDLRADIEALVDAALIAAGFAAGDVLVGLDGGGLITLTPVDASLLLADTSISDTGAFASLGDLSGLQFEVTAGTGVGASAKVVSNTANTLVFDTALILDGTSQYRVIEGATTVVSGTVRNADAAAINGRRDAIDGDKLTGTDPLVFVLQVARAGALSAGGELVFDLSVARDGRVLGNDAVDLAFELVRLGDDATTGVVDARNVGTGGQFEVTDTGAGFDVLTTANDLTGLVFQVTAGAGIGEVATIVSHTADTLVLDRALGLQAGSAYRVVSLELGLTLPAGPFVRVDVTGTTPGTQAQINVAGQTLAGDFAIELLTLPGVDGLLGTGPGDPNGADDVEQLLIVANNVSLSLGDGGETFVDVTDGSGFLVIAGNDVAAQIGARVAINVPEVSVSGDFTVAINTGTAAFSQTFRVGNESVSFDLAEGSFLRVEGAGVSIDIAGQSVAGDFSIESTTVNVTETVVGVVIRNASLSLGNDTTTFFEIFQDEGQDAAFLIRAGPAAGQNVLAGHFAATFSLTLPDGAPDISFNGPLLVEFNTGTAAVDIDLTIQGATVPLDLEAGPFFRATFGNATTTATLEVLGQTLSGIFGVQVRTDAAGANQVTVAIANVTLQFTDGTAPLVTLSSTSGLFVLDDDGFAGAIDVSVDAAAGGITIGGTLTLEVNNTSGVVSAAFGSGADAITLVLEAGPFVRVTVGPTEPVTPANVTVDPTATGAFGSDAAQLVTFLQTRIDAAITAGGVGLAAGSVRVALGNPLPGSLFVQSIVVSSAVPGLVIANRAAFESLIEAARDASDIGQLNGDPIAFTLNLVGVISTPAFVTVAGQRIEGRFFFQQSTVGGKQVVVFSASEVRVELGSDDVKLLLSDGAGAFILSDVGIAGAASGAVALLGDQV